MISYQFLHMEGMVQMPARACRLQVRCSSMKLRVCAEYSVTGPVEWHVDS